MSGKMLVDYEILEAIQTGKIGLTNFDLDSMDITSSTCPIQASSLDLSVGEIFFPKTEKTGIEHRPAGETGYRLAAGHSVVIETLEEITLAKTISGLCFPPARLARDGLLMTNPGHIDPGFSGKLTFTLINFGREECSLRQGDAISTFLFFDLDSGAKVPYDERSKKTVSTESKISNILNRLAPDFANVSERAKKAANSAVEKTDRELEMKKIYIPIFGALGIAFLTFMGTNYVTHVSKVSKTELEPLLSELKADIQSEISQENGELVSRIAPLEHELVRQNATAEFSEIRKRLKAIEQNIRATDDPNIQAVE